MNKRKLEAIRNELFKSTADMARKLGISSTQMANIISGKANMNIASLAMLVKFYRIDPLWLFEEDTNYELRYHRSSKFKNNKVTKVLSKDELQVLKAKKQRERIKKLEEEFNK